MFWEHFRLFSMLLKNEWWSDGNHCWIVWIRELIINKSASVFSLGGLISWNITLFVSFGVNNYVCVLAKVWTTLDILVERKTLYTIGKFMLVWLWTIVATPVTSINKVIINTDFCFLDISTVSICNLAYKYPYSFLSKDYYSIFKLS